MSYIYLTALDEVTWAQGGQCARLDSLMPIPPDPRGDAHPDLEDPIDYLLAVNLAQMMTEINRRYTHLQLAPVDFGFGLPTSPTAADVLAAADQGVESGVMFFTRPMAALGSTYGGRHYNCRYLRQSGTWEPSDPSETSAVFEIHIVNPAAPGGGVPFEWQWKKNGGALSDSRPIREIDDDVSEGLKIRFRMRAPELHKYNPGEEFQTTTEFSTGQYWTILAYKDIRREPYAMVMALATRMMDAIEDVADGNQTYSYDFGSGAEPCSAFWTGNNEDIHGEYTRKRICYDADVTKQRGYCEIINSMSLATPPELWGLDSALQQVRRMINDLRWVTVYADHSDPTDGSHWGTSGELSASRWALERFTVTEAHFYETAFSSPPWVAFLHSRLRYPHLSFDFGVGATDPGAWPTPTAAVIAAAHDFASANTNPDDLQSSRPMQVQDAIMITATPTPSYANPSPPPASVADWTYSYERHWTGTRMHLAIMKMVNLGASPKVVRFKLDVTPITTDGLNETSQPQGPTFADGGDVAGSLKQGIFADDGNLSTLLATLGTSTTVTVRDATRGAQILGPAAGEAAVVLAPGDNYFAVAHAVDIDTLSTGTWRPGGAPGLPSDVSGYPVGSGAPGQNDVDPFGSARGMAAANTVKFTLLV